MGKAHLAVLDTVNATRRQNRKIRFERPSQNRKTENLCFKLNTTTIIGSGSPLPCLDSYRDNDKEVYICIFDSCFNSKKMKNLLLIILLVLQSTMFAVKNDIRPDVQKCMKKAL